MFNLDARIPIVFGNHPGTAAAEATLMEGAVKVALMEGVAAATAMDGATKAATMGSAAKAETMDGADTTLQDGAVSGGTVVGFDVSPRHAAGCACCNARSNAGRALAALLQDRARGKITFFTRVVAVVRTPAGRAELLDALEHDPVASACFRLSLPAGPGSPNPGSPHPGSAGPGQAGPGSAGPG